MQGEFLPNVTSVKDLGIDTTYRGKVTKRTLYHRISLGLKRCSKVAQLGCPKRRKFRLVQGSCIPKATYGTPLLQPSQTKFSILRTNVSKALGHAQNGASPWIANNLLDKKSDAEYHVVLQTLRFWRSYFVTFPDRKGPMLAKIQTHGKGPSLALRQCILKLGEINPEGFLLTGCVGKVDWTTCSSKFLQWVINIQWDKYVCDKLQHRSHFECDYTDKHEIQKIAKNLHASDYFSLCVHLNGVHYTNDIKQKYHEVENVCPHCKSECDSRVHRTLGCKALDSLRSDWDHSTWNVASETTTAHFGLLALPSEIATARLRIPITSVTPSITRELDDLTEVVIFFDGSCFFSGNPLTSLAGSGACIVTPFPKREVAFQHRCLLPTRDHNSHRAEIYALILALTMGKNVRLYGDCLSVLDIFTDILECLRQGLPPRYRDNVDLWEHVTILATTRLPHISIHKTKGHACESGSSPQHWEAWANNTADHAAKQAIVVDHLQLYEQFKEFDHVLNQRHLAHHKILVFQVKAAQAVFRANHSHATPQVVTQCGIVPEDTMTYPVPVVSDQITQDCPINPQFLQKLLIWLVSLQWEQHPVNCTSYIELCLEYIFSSKSYPPVPIEKFPNRKNQSGKKWILCDDPQHPIDINGYNMGQVVQGLSRTVNWLRGKHKICILPACTKNQVVALKCYGYVGKPAGVPIRAKLNFQGPIDEWCRVNLRGCKSLQHKIPSFETFR